MRTTIVCAAFGALLAVGAACGSPDATSPNPASPGATNPPTGSVPAPPAQNFPAPAGASRTFVFDHEVSYPVRGYTMDSRFILYENRAFVLRYGLSLEYRGRYTDSTAVIVFDWDGWSTAGAWGATGTLVGDTLTVRYNVIMSLSDFEDAAYVLR